MYYEEKIINGILHYRGIPNGKFHELSKTDITRRFEETMRELNRLINEEM